MSRAEATERNRAAVLAAARTEFENLGFHQATVDSIAEAAGFSKGVVYSQFGSKDGLFLAVLEQNIERRNRDTAHLLEEMSGPEELPKMPVAAITENLKSVAWQAALLEFRAHAWRHPEVNEAYRLLHRKTIDSVGGYIAAVYGAAGIEPPAPAGLMGLASLVAGTGTIAEYMADPDIDVIALAGMLAPSTVAVPYSGARSQP
jgi:AcrR family transcriptional regulator